MGSPRAAAQGLWFAFGLFITPLLSSNARADLKEIESRGTLRVLAVTLDDFPEFISTKPGGEPGFDREVLAGFGTLHHVKVEVVPVSAWDDLIPSLIKGKGDLIANSFTVTEPRKRLVHFTSEVFPNRAVAVTRKPHRVVSTLGELREEKVGVVKGTSMADVVAASGIPAANVDDSLPAGSTLAALKAGRITCAIEEVAGVIPRARQDSSLQMGLFLGPPSSFAYGVRKEDPELLRELNDYINNLRHTPTWGRLVVKYFGADALSVLTKARQD